MTKPLWLLAAPVIFLMLWCGGYVVAKIGLQYTGPMTLLVLRYVAAVALMAVLFVALRLPWPRRRAEWRNLIVVGLLIQAVYFGCSYLAFDTDMAAGTVALIMSLQPILVALIAPIWTDERIGWRRWAGFAMGLGGTALVIVARLDVAAPTVLGLAFAAVGLCGMTAGTLWEKRFGTGHHPVTANLIGFGAGLAGVLPLALATEDMAVAWTAELAATLAYLVIGNSLIATYLLLAMIRAGEVARVSALLFLVPPGAALLAWGLLAEIMPPLAWAGMALAGLGVLIATRAR